MHISANKTHIICTDGKMFELKAPLSAANHSLSTEAVQLMEHAKECSQRCKKLETCVTQLQHESETDSLFPIIVSRRPSNASSLKEKTANEAR